MEHENAHTKGKGPNYPYSKVIWDIAVMAWMIEPQWVPSELVASPVLTDDFRWRQEPGRHQKRVATNLLRDFATRSRFLRFV